ncbi:MAG TPA: hypothetical protein PKD66_10335 [Azonexus sp.]|nr:hypothetical protein [Azonexus sp.]
MQKLSAAILFATCAVLASCKSNEAKPEDTTAPATATTATTSTKAASAPAKPACKPAPVTKKSKKGSKKTAAKTDTTPADCEPAKPKSESGTNEPSAKTIETKPGAAAAPAGAGSVKTGTECKPCVVKSRDGTFDGEVHGNIPAGSKWARLQIGMHQSEVERILGTTSNIRGYVTGKAFIPFYFGSDSHRYEAVYAGQGSVAYTGGGIGGGQGVLMMINYDPKIE